MSHSLACVGKVNCLLLILVNRSGFVKDHRMQQVWAMRGRQGTYSHYRLFPGPWSPEAVGPSLLKAFGNTITEVLVRLYPLHLDCARFRQTYPEIVQVINFVTY